MTELIEDIPRVDIFDAASWLDLGGVRESLELAGGGSRIVHSSNALEIGVEVLTSPGRGEVRIERGDALYVVLEGCGVLGVAGQDPLALVRGEAAIVRAGARHVLFGNPSVSLLIVSAPGSSAPTTPLALCRRP